MKTPSKSPPARAVDLLELAWGIIANANGGRWDEARPEWQQAAKDWCAGYHAWLEVQPADDGLVSERSKTHELKVWPAQFIALRSGRKTFEYRRNDRDFCIGDFLALREWDPKLAHYTGWAVRVRVRYILHGPDFGVPAGFCVMAIEFERGGA